ncbi:terpene synthase family protein [Actinomadura rubrisoli]|uniref:Terpene synthase n=1 Tax=Actinomadura rubrisoli TaxID=2530368 RepID=A0A4R5BKY4_9ACTN|nr:terpene synthase family protein [Actinomadura rubrisoli]TDD84482.1 hypothetical protein E1298_19890 [Actinomadura rubrisoli]
MSDRMQSRHDTAPEPPTHPDLASAGHELLGWVESMGLVTTDAAKQRLAAERHDLGAALIVPEGSRDDLALTAQWSAFICLLDDRFDATPLGTHPDRVRTVMRPLTDILRGDDTAQCAKCPSDPLVRAFNDLWRRTAAGMPPAWRHRFTADYQDFADASCEEAEIRAAGRELSLREYVVLRSRTITSAPMMDVLERTGPFGLTAVAHAPEVKDLRRTAIDVVGWTNDVGAGAAETSRGQLNLVSLVARERELPDAQAVAYAKSMIRRRLRDFERACAELSGKGSGTEMRRCVAAMRLYLYGTLQWCSLTRRYTSEGPGDG